MANPLSDNMYPLPNHIERYLSNKQGLTYESNAICYFRPQERQAKHEEIDRSVALSELSDYEKWSDSLTVIGYGTVEGIDYTFFVDPERNGRVVAGWLSEADEEDPAEWSLDVIARNWEEYQLYAEKVESLERERRLLHTENLRESVRLFLRNMYQLENQSNENESGETEFLSPYLFWDEMTLFYGFETPKRSIFHRLLDFFSSDTSPYRH